MIVQEEVAARFLCCGPPSARQMNPQLHCAGQKCMAWRWSYAAGAHKPDNMGYCGHVPDQGPLTEATAGEGDEGD